MRWSTTAQKRLQGESAASILGHVVRGRAAAREFWEVESRTWALPLAAGGAGAAACPAEVSPSRSTSVHLGPRALPRLLGLPGPGSPPWSREAACSQGWEAAPVRAPGRGASCSGRWGCRVPRVTPRRTRRPATPRCPTSYLTSALSSQWCFCGESVIFAGHSHCWGASTDWHWGAAALCPG